LVSSGSFAEPHHRGRKFLVARALVLHKEPRMSKIYQYFNIPFEPALNDQAPPYTVWYATWSTQPPVLEPGMLPPLVLCATADEPPEGAIALGTGSKDPPPPPPPPIAGPISDYRASVSAWLDNTRDADE
jgi:hypothetical protein